MVTARPRARSTAAMPPAWSMRDSTQPPKISPLALVSAGMAMTRTVKAPRGLGSLIVVQSFSFPDSTWKLCSTRWKTGARMKPVAMTMMRPEKIA